MFEKKKILTLLAALDIFLIFFFIVFRFVSSQVFLSFDTLREVSYSRFIVDYGILSKSTEFILALLLALVSLETNIPVEILSILGGYLILSLTGLFVYLTFRRLTNRSVSLSISFVFLFSPLIIFNASNFRPEIFAYFSLFSIFFLLTFFYISERKEYLYSSLIFCLFFFFSHKTGKIAPFMILFSIFIIIFISEKRIRSGIKNNLIPTLIVFAFFFVFLSSSYFHFIYFYLAEGRDISPQGFNSLGEPLLGFTNKFGLILGTILILSVFPLLDYIFLQKRAIKDVRIYLFILPLIMIFYSFISILPILGLSILPSRFYPYLLISSLFLLPFIFKRSFSTSLKVIILFLLIVGTFPLLTTDNLRITANIDYLQEVYDLPIYPGDVIVTTFTSSPAMINSALLKSNYSGSIVILSGYHFWGESKEVLESVRDIYLEENYSNFNAKICKSIETEYLYIQSLPEAKDFLVPTMEERESILASLSNPSRIIIVYPKFDIETRKFEGSEVDNWWKYRSLYNLNHTLLDNFELEEIYKSNNIQLYLFDGKCP